MKVALYEMDSNFAKDSGITMDGAIAKPSNDNITLILRNNGFRSICLEEGRVLGVLLETTLLHLDLEEGMPWMDEKNPMLIQALHASKETSSSGERHQALLDIIHWKIDTQAENESTKLAKLISEYQDVFALNNLEFTNLVQHHIEMGYVNPIFQHAGRIPFALCE